MNKQVSRIRKILIIAACALLGIILLVFWSISTMLSGVCSEKYLESAISPDSKYKAVIYESDCGATTAGETSVKIIRATADEARGGSSANIFSAKSLWNNIAVKWVNNSELSITHSVPNELILAKKEAYMGIEIKYEFKESQKE